MIRLESGTIYFKPSNEEEIEVGKLADGKVEDGNLTLGTYGFPLERFPELQIAWNELYPDGKPVEDIQPKPPVLTDAQKAIELMVYLMQSDEFLTTAGIPPYSPEDLQKKDESQPLQP